VFIVLKIHVYVMSRKDRVLSETGMTSLILPENVLSCIFCRYYIAPKGLGEIGCQFPNTTTILVRDDEDDISHYLHLFSPPFLLPCCCAGLLCG
jgi:hypothetical protein